MLGLALLDDIGELVLAEPSDGMLAVIADKLAAADLPHVKAIKLDLVADPPPGDPFDLAVSFLVLHHIKDTAAALAAVRRLLRPGGRIALSDLDTEDGTFHSAEAEGIHHLGFDRTRPRRAGAERPASSTSRRARRSTSRTRVAATRPSCCSAGTPDLVATGRPIAVSVEVDAQEGVRDRRSTGRAGRAPARPRSWHWLRLRRLRRRATPSSPRRRGSRSTRGDYEVVERTGGGGGTDFGVPSSITDLDRRPVDAAEAERQARLVEAAWAVFARVAAGAPAELRKGPRGGGRDRDKMVGHVAESDTYYAREIGITGKRPDPTDSQAIEAERAAMLDDPPPAVGRVALAGRTWTARYAARRIAWHALDHAWEMEDRSEP